MRPQQGFTLVEVLAALVIGSLLLLGVSSAVSGLAADLKRGRSDDDASSIAAAAPALKAMLEAAVSSAHGADRAGPRQLSVRTTPPQSFGDAGLVDLDLSITHTADGDALDAVVSSADLGTRVQTRRDRLLTGFASLRWRYSPDTTGAGLPRLIRLEAIAKDGRRYAIVAAPRVTAVAGCRFDPISMACRS